MVDLDLRDRSRAAARAPRRASRTLTRVGAVLVLAGTLVLGYVAWQLYGTTWLAEREQQRTVEATERVWSVDHGAPVSREDRALAKQVVALVRIPAWGEDYVVPAYRGTDDETLERGFGIFEGSPEPGASGNFALGGHRVTHGEPLRDMPSLRAGDEVVVETADATYRYVLDDDGSSRTVSSEASWVTDSLPIDPATRGPVVDAAGSPRLLTLVTCAEIFHTEERLVAFGHLVARDT
ncbi:class E sortase [Nocardioides coralli]|uniref:class E sortase n=1 Tax=Nocardioides coralli TaxID=2872154 RepID=UPI001CA3D8C9|nr:class E sortase [Nocardioides coralli]QZY28320.1 class E sortase [Nocardioides coralli]